MRAVWLSVPEDFLEERHRLGHDKMDELWDGVIHMVPPPTWAHSSCGFDVALALAPIAKRRGLRAFGDGVGIFDATGANCRIPDAGIARPEHISKRGLESAELVVEVLSPDDESRDKLPFYAKVGVCEVWLIEPETHAIEILTLVAGAYVTVPFEAGVARSPTLGITLEIVAGPLLRLRDGDELADV